MKEGQTAIPIIGKWYKVISGPYLDFVGECVSYRLEHDLPVILQDLDFNGRAVRMNEIEQTMRQPDKVDIRNEEIN
jgi:hypothetical protein